MTDEEYFYEDIIIKELKCVDTMKESIEYEGLYIKYCIERNVKLMNSCSVTNKHIRVFKESTLSKN
jgi:hypothetical protein